MKSEFRKCLFDGDGYAALEWTTEGSANNNTVPHDGVIILEIEDGKVKRFYGLLRPRSPTEQVVFLGTRFAGGG